MADHWRTELGLSALEMALWNRRPGPDLIHHADHGGHDPSIAFGQQCREVGIAPSMGSVGDGDDNALAERLFATLDWERLDRQPFTSKPEARMALFDDIEIFDNRERRHSKLGDRSPVASERDAERGVVA